ncbi:hypothetical protein BGZ93_000861 [Podila epicladia]|nr:hypothetical protein BGZ93_000861 [Podila epicladia]KAG0092136.1 hypothetical protein BGZ92_010720 [Podila epicladia]
MSFSFLTNRDFWKTFVTPATFSVDDIPSLDNKVALVTGANSGLGFWTAVELAAKGAHVFLGCRDPFKAKDAIQRIRAEITFRGLAIRPKLEVLVVDLEDVKSCHLAAANFLARGLPLHILINNGGMNSPRFELTAQGIEKLFAVNHLGPFALTLALLDRIKASQPSRIVFQSSIAHESTHPFDLTRVSDPTTEANQDGELQQRYSRSKLCNIAIAKALARRLEHEHVYVNAVHPGIVYTYIGRHLEAYFGPVLGWMYHMAFRLFAMSAKDACLTGVYCATSPEVEEREYRGLYFIPTANLLAPSPMAEDEVFQEQLWAYSEELIREITG